jgi:hypothetical protein
MNLGGRLTELVCGNGVVTYFGAFGTCISSMSCTTLMTLISHSRHGSSVGQLRTATETFKASKAVMPSSLPAAENLNEDGKFGQEMIDGMRA